MPAHWPRNSLGGKVIGHLAVPDAVDRLERAVDRDAVEGITHGTAQLIVRAKACDAKRGGRLERADIGDLAHQAREVTAGRRVANHVVDLAGLERLKALVDVGEGLLVGRNALLGERFLRGRGGLNARVAVLSVSVETLSDSPSLLLPNTAAASYRQVPSELISPSVDLTSPMKMSAFLSLSTESAEDASTKATLRPMRHTRARAASTA